MRQRQIDAVVTVGTGGDKMFWGRLAAWRAGVPVILSALHSTGLPDHVEWPNRLLAPITDGFIGVADAHGHYLAESEGCPLHKVRVIPNGVDVERFQPRAPSDTLRAQLGLLPPTPVAGIVAALRPEKNHELFLRVAARVREIIPEARFLIIGDGPRREMLESLAAGAGPASKACCSSARGRTSRSCWPWWTFTCSPRTWRPTRCRSWRPWPAASRSSRRASARSPKRSCDGEHGFLAAAGDEDMLSARLAELLHNPLRAAEMGRAARQRVVAHYSLERMVEGYQDLIDRLYLPPARSAG